jgi:uncharacterized protein (UPF0303 family)
MGFQKVEFEFPDEQEEKGLEVEETGAVEIDLTGKKTAEDYKEPEPEPEVEAKEEVEIEVVDDTPKADRKRKASEPPEDVTEEELENYSEKVRKRIQHFSKGYHDERRAKETAERERKELERYAKQLSEENKQLQESAVASQNALLEQSKKEAEKDVNVAKFAYKKAYDAGNADKVLEAQEKLTDAKLKLDKLSDIPLQDESFPVQSEETAVQTPQVDEKASNWAKDNTWFGADDEMTAYAMGVHNKIVKEGVDPSSDEYYEKIDSRMRSTFSDYFGEDEQPEEQETKKRKSNVVAPASRSTSPKKVTLTRTQVAIAKKLGVPLELYAKKVAEEMRKV